MAFPGIETPMSNMNKPCNSCSELIQSIQAYLKDTHFETTTVLELEIYSFGDFSMLNSFLMLKPLAENK